MITQINAYDILVSDNTPPWVDITKFLDICENLNIKVYFGDRHNRTDGEVHYTLTKNNNEEYILDANLWDCMMIEWSNVLEWMFEKGNNMYMLYKIENNEVKEVPILKEDNKNFYTYAPRGNIYPDDVIDDMKKEGVPTTYEEEFLDGLASFDTCWLGVSYYRTREEAELKIVPPPPELIEPSDLERSTWSDVTQEYVYQLEQAWDMYYETLKQKYESAIAK